MFNCPNTYAHIKYWDELKVLFFLFGKHVCVETANNKMWHSVVVSHIIF